MTFFDDGLSSGIQIFVEFFIEMGLMQSEYLLGKSTIRPRQSEHRFSFSSPELVLNLSQGSHVLDKQS